MKKLSFIGAALDMGGVKQGSRFAYETLKIMGLLEKIEEMGYEVSDLKVNIKNGHTLKKSDDRLNHFEQIKKQVHILKDAVDLEIKRGQFPIVIGGDHTCVMGTMSGVLKNKDSGLIYVDAHADINTKQTTTTGNIHGMPVAALMGLEDSFELGVKLNSKKIVYIGLRDVEEEEKKILKEHDIKCYSIYDVDRLGIDRVMDETFNYLDGDFHLSFDVDSLDPNIAPATGIHLNGGLNFREARLILERAHESGNLSSLEFVEFNPLFDENQKTAKLLMDLIKVALGEKNY